MKIISTEKAPGAGAAHLSQAVVHGDLVFCSGQLSLDPETGKFVPGSAKEQTLRALKNMEAVLHAAGSNRENVIKTRAFITDIVLWGEVNEGYRDFFGDHKPARSVIPINDLQPGFLIEIEAIAARTNDA